MAQTEIYEILKSNPGKYYTTKELAEMLGIRVNTIKVNMNKLRFIKGIYMKENIKGRLCHIMYKEDEEDELRQEEISRGV